jgi:hypothetical protein
VIDREPVNFNEFRRAKIFTELAFHRDMIDKLNGELARMTSGKPTVTERVAKLTDPKMPLWKAWEEL